MWAYTGRCWGDLLAAVVAIVATLHVSAAASDAQCNQVATTLLVVLSVFVLRDQARHWKHEMENLMLRTFGLVVLGGVLVQYMGSLPSALVLLLGIKCSLAGQSSVAQAKHVARLVLHAALYVVAMEGCDPVSSLTQHIPNQWRRTITLFPPTSIPLFLLPARSDNMFVAYWRSLTGADQVLLQWQVSHWLAVVVAVYCIASVYLWLQNDLSGYDVGAMLLFDTHACIVALLLRGLGGCALLPMLIFFSLYMLLSRQFHALSHRSWKDALKHTVLPTCAVCGAVAVAWPLLADMWGVSAGERHTTVCAAAFYAAQSLMLREHRPRWMRW